MHIARLDVQLVEDGTYFVHEAGGEIVACGGWSRRSKLFAGEGDVLGDDRLLDPLTEPARVRAMFVRGDWTRRGLGRAILESCERAARAEGFSQLLLGATLPGEPLYRAFGFRVVRRRRHDDARRRRGSACRAHGAGDRRWGCAGLDLSTPPRGGAGQTSANSLTCVRRTALPDGSRKPESMP